MKKQLHNIRVAYENWLYEDRFNDLIDILNKYDTGIDQVALFSSPVHSPLTVEETRYRASIMKKRIEVLKEKGYVAGINILATIGHHHEDLDHTIGEPYQGMVGQNGEVSRATFCMNDERFRNEYVSTIYKIYAATNPDFIWIDDDIRYGHMPIHIGCFCDRCISMFNEENGFSYTRETLRQDLENVKVDVSQKWLKHNSDTICTMLKTISEAVYSENENITLGFMACDRCYDGGEYERFADALSDGGKHEIMWRPGGGVYTDMTFDLIVNKTSEIGRQNAYLPEYVTVIMSEVENFPYNLLKKTPKSTATEAAMAMTVGCTGAALNILPSETLESISNIEPHLKAIADIKPFCQKLQTITAGMQPLGIHTGWRKDSQATVSFFSEYSGDDDNRVREMFYLGLPESHHKDAAQVTILSKNRAAVMDDEEITKILSGGVFIDASAVNYLTSRGFGELIGFAVDKYIPVDAREIYTADKINDGFVGGIRNCRQAFNPGDSFALKPLSSSCRVISSLIDYHNNILAECTSGLYENKLGGRVYVSGYYPFTGISDYSKTIQLKRILVWLSKETLISYVDSYVRVRNSTLYKEGKICVTLFNITNDMQKNVKVCVRCDKSNATVYTMQNEISNINADSSDEEYKLFSIDEIRPYEGVILYIG